MIKRFWSLLLLLIILLIPSLFQEGSFLLSKERRNASSSPIQFRSSAIYGPYVGGEEVTFEWEYVNQSSTYYSSVNEYFMVICPSFSSGPYVSRRVSVHSLPGGHVQKTSYKYKIPPSRLNTESGLIFRIGIFYQNGYIGMIERKLKTIISQNINPLNYRSTPYVIKDRSFYLNDTDIEESFLFNEYRDYVECDQYNRLLFNNLSFQYRYPRPLSYTNARIKFLDPENIFPLIDKDGDGYRSITANLVENSGVVKIEPTQLCYDPLTLISNDDGKGNKSKYLYVPKGKSHRLEKYEFIIEANGLGINKTSFSHCLETSISPYYLGDCLEGDFCIVGGVKE